MWEAALSGPAERRPERCPPRGSSLAAAALRRAVAGAGARGLGSAGSVYSHGQARLGLGSAGSERPRAPCVGRGARGCCAVRVGGWADGRMGVPETGRGGG